jgi:hypothetical protein
MARNYKRKYNVIVAEKSSMWFTRKSTNEMLQKSFFLDFVFFFLRTYYFSPLYLMYSVWFSIVKTSCDGQRFYSEYVNTNLIIGNLQIGRLASLFFF